MHHRNNKTCELLRPGMAAGLIGVSIRTLQRWTSKGHGPACVRIGAAVYYRRTDIEEWIASLAPQRANH